MTALGAGLPAEGALQPLMPKILLWPVLLVLTPSCRLESGVNSADILAFAQDHGAWSLRTFSLSSTHHREQGEQGMKVELERQQPGSLCC
ncbi:hypothetical protein P4154_00005 [Pseudomonas aeruginosa]|nr:hypothetical protein [Pseudomonas aeruginosa]